MDMEDLLSMDVETLRVIRDQLGIIEDTQAESLARPTPGPGTPIPARVKFRLVPALLHTVRESYIERVAPAKKFDVAPLQDPPIPTGLTDTIQKLKSIVLKDSAIGEDEYKQVPVLLRRVKHLLRVYYDAKVTRRRPAEFKYCDVSNMATVGADLHECGLTLLYMPNRLRALFRITPEMDKFLFDEPLDVGKWRAEVWERENAIAADPEADENDRRELLELDKRNRGDVAAYQMAFLVGDLLVAWILIKPLTDVERSRVDKAMARLIEYSCAPQWRKAQVLGDPLTDAMRPIYEDPSQVARFARAGGLPALFEDWSSSYAKEKYVKYALEAMPKSVWANQSVETLVGVMQGLLHKMEWDDRKFVKDPIVVRAIHEMFVRYGLEPFERAANISDSEILFYFLYRRLSRKPDAYRSYNGMQVLLTKYLNVVGATRQRCGWNIMTISDRWNRLGKYGCANRDNCPEYKALLKLRSQRRRGFRNSEVEARLYRWGAESKACASCREVCYCSAACQKAHWKTHKPECQKKTAKDRSEMEVDI